MDVTAETPAQANERNRRVLQTAKLTWLSGRFVFAPCSPNRADQAALDDDTLAVIRDGSRLSSLRRRRLEDEGGTIRVFSVHFPPKATNSGFVGWLATEIKNETGSGVGVVCGFDSQVGDLFDYWCVPDEVAGRVLEVIDGLRSVDPVAATRE